MTTSEESDQIQFWRGNEGDDYAKKYPASEDRVKPRYGMWNRILSAFAQDEVGSILEVGANVGTNLVVLKNLTNARLFAQEPNDNTRSILIKSNIVPAENALGGMASKIPLEDGSVDLVFTCGVLIHIAPDNLLDAYKEIHRVSGSYVLSIEYFSENPEKIKYKERDGLLFKRDFGGFWIDNFPDLELVDYGFFWRRATGHDNLTWWLFRKKSS